MLECKWCKDSKTCITVKEWARENSLSLNGKKYNSGQLDMTNLLQGRGAS